MPNLHEPLAAERDYKTRTLRGAFRHHDRKGGREVDKVITLEDEALELGGHYGLVYPDELLR